MGVVGVVMVGQERAEEINVKVVNRNISGL